MPNNNSQWLKEDLIRRNIAMIPMLIEMSLSNHDHQVKFLIAKLLGILIFFSSLYHRPRFPALVHQKVILLHLKKEIAVLLAILPPAEGHHEVVLPLQDLIGF
jgi:hypothetical protein